MFSTINKIRIAITIIDYLIGLYGIINLCLEIACIGAFVELLNISTFLWIYRKSKKTKNKKPYI